MSDAEIQTKEEAVKVIRDLRDRVKQLESRGEEERQAFAKMPEAITALTQAVKVLQEDHNRQTVATEFLGSDAGVARYVQRDGDQPRVRMLGEVIRHGEDAGAYAPGLLDDTQVHGEWHAQLRQMVQQRNMVRALSKYGKSKTADLALREHMKVAPAPIRKLFSDSANAGAEWIPDQHLPMLEEELRMARRTEALFQTMPMNDKEVRIPFLTTGLRPHLKGVSTSDDPAQYTSSSIVTDKRSITATGFAVRTQIDEDASEDSILAWEPIIRAELVAALVDGCNDAIINGDTAGTHQDTIAAWDIRSRWGSSGLGGSADHRRAWIGLRARAADVSNTTDQGSAKTYAGFLAARAKLASPHGVAGDLVCIVSPEYYLGTILGLSEVATLEKYGAAASVLSGEVAKLGGVPLVVDEFVGGDLNASGVYDDTTKTKTGFILVNRKRFIMGNRRGTMVELDKDITRGVVNVVSTVRKVFFTVDSSTKKNVHWSYNL